MSIESAKVIALESKSLETTGVKLEQTKVGQTNNLKEVIINLEGEEKTAKVSFSCLVAPQVNDSVLIASNEKGEYFVLSILERSESSQEMTLAFPDTANLVSASGAINLLSTESISMTTQSLNSVAHNSVYKSAQTIVDFEELTAKGKSATVSIPNMRILADNISTVAKQAVQKFANYVRRTESFDKVQAGQMNRNVDGLFSVDTKYTVMLSDKDTKIDAERIHMG